MAAALTSTKRRRRAVFASVFPVPAAVTTAPTPVATPDPSFVLPGQAFGGPVAAHGASFGGLPSEPDGADEQIRLDRAWHTATSFLTLPRAALTAGRENVQDDGIYSKWFDPCPPDVGDAIARILSSRDTTRGSTTPDDRDLVEWYTNEVRRHFLEFVRPQVQEADDNQGDPEQALFQLLRTLQLAQRVYVHPLEDHIAPALTHMYDPIEDVESWERSRREAVQLKADFRRNLHALMAYSMPQERFSSLLTDVLTTECFIVLGIVTEDDQPEVEHAAQRDLHMSDNASWQSSESYGAGKKPLTRSARGRGNPDNDSVRESRQKILDVFRSLEDVGLGREKGQRVFAEVMHQMLTDYVQMAFSHLWSSPSTVPDDLQFWVENRYARLVVEVLHCLRSADEYSPDADTPHEDLVGLADVERWGEMAVGRLGRMRVDQLFDIVVDWDNSMGAVEDLKAYITAPATRTHLTGAFASVIAQRLLHPGASTTEILQIYISLIKSFALLDPKGVLLDRVARPIRRYLKERDDTVKVIVTGLLADAESSAAASPDVLVELAVELSQASELAGRGDDDGDLDWDDMAWVPDPIDAGPDYKKNKGSDVVGSLMSLFDSKDVFVKEFQNIMGERLLKKDFDLDKEVRVLELLKLRFGDGALQSCEVMLRDVRESKAIDRNIRSDERMETRQSPRKDRTGRPIRTAPEGVQLHAKILSRLFWPDLHDEGFKVPDEVAALQSRYEAGYEKLKQSRKLTWLHALGQVTVELDLADRVITEEVQTWQASVIDVFQDGAAHGIAGLMEVLRMPEGMVRNAVIFWVGKLVLREGADGNYTVLETLAQSDEGTKSTTVAAAASASAALLSTDAAAAVKPAAEQALAKFKVYWQFIVGMLTNGGPMASAQIGGMLRLAVAGGVDFGDEELREFLGAMVKEGKLEVAPGGRYKVRS